MKKIIIALMTAGLVPLSAMAQTNSINAKNYPVCKNDNGYHICGEVPNFANATPTPGVVTYEDRSTDRSVDVTRPTVYYEYHNAAPVSPNNYPSSSANTTTTVPEELPYPYMREHGIIYADEARAPYEGLPSRQYDGPQKNIYRNINVNQTSIHLPGADGK